MNEDVKDTVTEEVEETQNTGNEEKSTESEVLFTQEQVDKMIKDRLEKQQKQFNKQQDEAKKLSKMNADEKKNYELEQKEKAILEREQAVIKKELTAEAKQMLSDRSLPVELHELINYESADTVKSSVEKLAKSWEVAVQKGVADKLKGKEPLTKAPEPTVVNPFADKIAKYK